ncbi:MAG: hypothetical protein ACFFBP_21555 [Promethearchaeota archaeon]
MEIIRYLGEFLAKEIGISPTAARGLLKLSIKEELGAFVELRSVNYGDLYKVINNSFKNRLIKLEIADYGTIIDSMLNELTKNQSLITISEV